MWRAVLGLRAIMGFAMSGFRLREGLTFCRVSDRLIFLDVPTDRYFCLGREAADAFDRLLEFGPVRALEPALLSLVDRGMLVPGRPQERPSTCPEMPTAGSLLHAGGTIPRFQNVFEALARRLVAEGRLRWTGLARTLVRARAQGGRFELDLDLARNASAAFAESSLLRSRQARCISISVATMAWLSARHCAATLVIGVKLHPFQAHCWILVGDQLVNDDLDAVRAFTPILVI